MRVAFLGVGATGKSTLAKYLAKEKSLPFNPVGSRSTAKEMGFVGGDDEGRPYYVDRADRVTYEVYASNDPDINPETWQLPPNLRRRDAAIKAMDQYDGDRPTCRPIFQARLQLVTDRTPLDDAAYAMTHCPSIVDDAFLDRAIAAMARYDFVFGCPRSEGQWLDGDPARQGDGLYYRKLEIVLAGLVDEWLVITGLEEGPLCRIKGSDLEVRKAQVLHAVAALG